MPAAERLPDKVDKFVAEPQIAWFNWFAGVELRLFPLLFHHFSTFTPGLLHNKSVVL